MILQGKRQVRAADGADTTSTGIRKPFCSAAKGRRTSWTVFALAAASMPTMAHGQSPTWMPEVKKMQCTIASAYSNYVLVTPVFERDPNRDLQPDWRANVERLFNENPAFKAKLNELGNVVVNFDQWGALCNIQNKAWPEIPIGKRDEGLGDPPGHFRVWHDIVDQIPNWRILLQPNPANLATATQPVQQIGITVGSSRDKPVPKSATAPIAKPVATARPTTTARPAAKRKPPTGPCGRKGQRNCTARRE